MCSVKREEDMAVVGGKGGGGMWVVRELTGRCSRRASCG
jgi:hypothetical protein